MVTDGLPEAELLTLAAAVERESEHPLAVVRRADGDGAARARADGFEAVPGHGALAVVGAGAWRWAIRA